MTLGPDEVALLEEERDFLLRSLDDLDAERAAGEVEADEYERLRDDYTARAAAVLRSLEAGVDTRAQAPRSSTRRKVAVGAGVAAFVALAAVLLGGTLGERLPGETVTGNEQLRATEPVTGEPGGPGEPGEPDDLEALARAVEERPRDVEVRLSYADALLEAGEGAEALRQYDEAARLDPANAYPHARAAFVVFNAGLVDEALTRLDEAERVDPDFASTHFFRGIVLLNGRGDEDGARDAFEEYLELAPRGPYAEDAEVALESIAGRG